MVKLILFITCGIFIGIVLGDYFLSFSIMFGAFIIWLATKELLIKPIGRWVLKCIFKLMMQVHERYGTLEELWKQDKERKGKV